MTNDTDIKVLVIDDSTYNRDNIARILSESDGITVVGQAADGDEGLREVVSCEPDVITLDLEMPRMDGYTFLRILMTRRPTPVIVISTHSERDSVFKALELGAIDFIAKPARTVSPELDTIASGLVDKIRALGRLRPVKLRAKRDASPAVIGRAPTMPLSTLGESPLAGIVCIAASTGGPPALKEIFEALPGNLPVAILVSQHMPASFTGPFARRLDSSGPFEVREARRNDVLRPGLGLVAPGSGSIVVRSRSTGELYLDIESPDESSRRRAIVPSADRMMATAVAVMRRNVMGVVLTGMGSDGAKGVEGIHRAGGVTVAESEKTAVIFGMPGSAIATGAVDEVLPLEEVAGSIIRFARSVPR